VPVRTLVRNGENRARKMQTHARQVVALLQARLRASKRVLKTAFGSAQSARNGRVDQADGPKNRPC
jgi:hypothetical protein